MLKESVFLKVCLPQSLLLASGTLTCPAVSSTDMQAKPGQRPGHHWHECLCILQDMCDFFPAFLPFVRAYQDGFQAMLLIPFLSGFFFLPDKPWN